VGLGERPFKLPQSRRQRAPAPLGAGAAARSVGGATVPLGRRGPDERETIFGATRSLAEIGVEPARPELGRREAQRDIVVIRDFRAAVPAGTDLDAVGQDPIVGLVVARLAAIGDDVDLGTDAERLELTLERAVVILGDVSDGGHVTSPSQSTGTIPATRRSRGRGKETANRVGGRSEAEDRSAGAILPREEGA